MTTVRHDPRIKQQIKESLYKHIYGPVQLDFQNRLESLVTRNCALIRSGHRSFVFKGIPYNIDKEVMPKPHNRLHPSLIDEMKQYLEDKRRVNDEEIPFTTGYINQVLNASEHFEDYLMLFPECLHYVIRDFINSCPCKTRTLTDQCVKKIHDHNQVALDMIRARMTLNLIL